MVAPPDANNLTQSCHIVPQSKPQVRYVVVTAGEAGQRLDNFLLKRLPGVPKSHVYRLLRSGQVRVNKGRAKPATRLALDDQVRIPPARIAERPVSARPPDDLQQRLQAAILFEDDHYLALNKPAGLAVHGGTGLLFGVIEVVRAWQRYEFVELAHRLDRDTSGVLLLAKTRPALLRAQDAFRGDGASKRYLTLVDGAWQGGARVVESSLARDAELGGERRVRVDEMQGRSAKSRFAPLQCFPQGSYMEVQISTGRMHQIRVHAQSLGHAVAGDAKYGDSGRNQQWKKQGLRRMFLHAASLELAATAEFAALQLQAGLTPDLQAVLEHLRETT